MSLPAPSPPPVDLPREQRRVVARAVAAIFASAAVLLAFTFGLPEIVDLPADMGARLAFVLRLDLVVGLWVLLGIRQVARVRFVSAEDNPGSAYGPPSSKLAVPAAFLQNTLEQAVVAVIGHLALSTVSGDYPLAFIAGAVALFCVGRVCFLIGYPHGAGGRAFGVVLTMIPTFGAYGWTLIATGRVLVAG